MTDGQTIVKRALDQLRSSVNSEDDRSFSDTNLRDVWMVAREIERKQGDRLAMRNMARIEPILQTLESYSGAIDTFCQGFSPMAFVWGPIKLILQLGRQHVEVLDKLLRALKEIADVLPIMGKMKEAFGDEVDFQRTLALIYSDLLEFFQRVYKFLRRKAWHIYFTFDWGLFERRFRSIISNLKSHCDILSLQAAAIHYAEMRKMRQVADEEYEQDRQHKMRNAVFAWLSAAEDPQEDYLHQLSETRQRTTCDWILEHDKIYPWIENESGDAVINLTGIPGAGKSVLVGLLVEHLQTHRGITTLYYFCSQRGAGDNCCTVLRTFILQILQQHLDLAPIVHQAYFQKAPSYSKKGIAIMLRELLSNLKTTRIVLDGIDEWDLPFQEELLRSLVELQKHSGDSCKLLVSSRKEPQITKAMPKKSEFALEGNTAGGLQAYIHERVKELRCSFPGLEPELIHRVEQRLRQMAKGMFLWVRLVTCMLQQQVSELDFEEAIEKLPDGLEQAYGRILSRINDLKSDRKERAFRILFWLCGGLRPVKVHEVADGLALRPGQTVLSRKTRFQDMNRDIVDFCAPMVEKLENGVLSLVHFSAKEYLLDPQSGPFIAIAQAHFDIAFSCVTNLVASSIILPRFSGARHEMTEVEIESSIVQGSYGLQRYGHRFWAEHVRQYAKLAPNSDNQVNILAEALEALRVVEKSKYSDEILHGGSQRSYSVAEELPGLANFPAAQNFVNKWLHFRSELDKIGGDFESIDAQHQWQLQKDETYLTLIDHRLQGVMERLLTMEHSNLPPHITAVDFTEFASRFGFHCRFHKCTHFFSTVRSRDIHEAQHTPSFPCLQCDFSGRGFRSHRDLIRHTKQYHMSIEDFEVPGSLKMVGCSSDMNESGPSQYGRGSVRPPKCWNERGREILRKSFQQALDKIESDMISAPRTQEDSTMESETTSGTTTQVISLADIREKVAQNFYDTLLEFKSDVKSITSTEDPKNVPGNLHSVNLTVDQEVGMVMSDYPDFANLYMKTAQPKGGPHRKTLETLEVTDVDVLTTDSPTSQVSGTRIPYWSAVEEKEFPSLLEQYGSDYAKLSDCLKTKTSEEVKQYLLQLIDSGNSHLASLVEEADARFNHRLNSDESDSMMEAELTTAECSSQENLCSGIQDSTRPYETVVPGSMQTEAVGTSEHRRFREKKSASEDTAVTTGTGTVKAAPRKKRLSRRRVYCTFCKSRPEFSTDSAFQVHQRRFHSATRRVWVCKDVSIDKKFFGDCRACLTMKRYGSRHNAYTHLRKSHFPSKTPITTLERWQMEIEEKNPAYEAQELAAHVVQEPDPLPNPLEVTKKPKLGGGHQIKRLADFLKEVEQFPNSPSPPAEQSNNSQSDFGTPDARKHSEVVNPWRDILLKDVSFDQLLMNSTNRSIQHDSFSANDSVSEPGSDPRRALIRSEHVPRLPNLMEPQKVFCQDQVDALHHVLDTALPASKAYQEAFKKLESLSCTLKENLRDWRRHLALAPDIPFSI